MGLNEATFYNWKKKFGEILTRAWTGSSSHLGIFYPDRDNITFPRNNSKLSLPYVCRLILLILLTSPSMAPLLQDILISFSTASISLNKPLVKVFKPVSLYFERLTKSIHLLILPLPLASIALNMWSAYGQSVVQWYSSILFAYSTCLGDLWFQ